MGKRCFIFEDNPNTALSLVIRKCYNCDNILFSCSNSRLLKTIKTAVEEYEHVIVFFDLNPKNPQLIITLRSLCNRLIQHGVEKRVSIFPIICAEYIYLRSLHDYRGITVDRLDVNNTVNGQLSCEKYYKKLLDKVGLHDGYCAGEYFYVSLPIFDIVDSKHLYLVQNTLGITLSKVPYSDVYKSTYDFYVDLYKLFNLSFKDEIIGCNLFGVW